MTKEIDELLKQYVIPVFDEEATLSDGSPYIVRYKLKQKIKVKGLKITDGQLTSTKSNMKAIISPYGRFVSAKEAKDALNEPIAKIRHQCLNKLNGYSYEESEYDN